MRNQDNLELGVQLAGFALFPPLLVNSLVTYSQDRLTFLPRTLKTKLRNGCFGSFTQCYYCFYSLLSTFCDQSSPQSLQQLLQLFSSELQIVLGSFPATYCPLCPASVVYLDSVVVLLLIHRGFAALLDHEVLSFRLHVVDEAGVCRWVRFG